MISGRPINFTNQYYYQNQYQTIHHHCSGEAIHRQRAYYIKEKKCRKDSAHSVLGMDEKWQTSSTTSNSTTNDEDKCNFPWTCVCNYLQPISRKERANYRRKPLNITKNKKIMRREQWEKKIICEPHSPPRDCKLLYDTNRWFNIRHNFCPVSTHTWWWCEDRNEGKLFVEFYKCFRRWSSIRNLWNLIE